MAVLYMVPGSKSPQEIVEQHLLDEKRCTECRALLSFWGNRAVDYHRPGCPQAGRSPLPLAA